MTYPSTEGCKWVFSRGPKPPALVRRRVLQCRLWLHSFTVGLPYIKAYTTKSVVQQRKRTCELLFKGLHAKMLCATSTHMFLAKAIHKVRPHFEGAGECTLTLCPEEGNWNINLLSGLPDLPAYLRGVVRIEWTGTGKCFLKLQVLYNSEFFYRVPHHREYSRPSPHWD